MGAALVIPTKDVKMLIPNTAASLHRAFRKPKAVVLFRGPQVWPAQQGDKAEAWGEVNGESGCGEMRENGSQCPRGTAKTEVREVRGAHQGTQAGFIREAGEKQTGKWD